MVHGIKAKENPAGEELTQYSQNFTETFFANSFNAAMYSPVHSLSDDDHPNPYKLIYHYTALGARSFTAAAHILWND